MGSDSEFSVIIDGTEVPGRAGQTVLEAAAAAGVEIPHLCHDPRLAPTGACRMCLVEIEGERGFQTACTREVSAGMVVTTNTEAVRRLRRATLELILSEHRFVCETCDKDGDCKLQDYAAEYGVDGTALPSIYEGADRPNYATGNKALGYDPTLCIRCLRCVRICDEIQCSHALTLRDRAGDVLISTGFDVPLNDSTCELCGQCVSTCPTGAIYARGDGKTLKVRDVDVTTTTCPYCGVGCRLDLNVDRKTGRIARVTSLAGCVPNDGNTCVKGRFGLDYVGREDRLRTPLIRENGILREAGWDEALDLAARRFAAIRDQSGSDALAGLSSAKTTNEENYVMQKFVRAVIGTNNVDHCARLCHASTVAGLARAFGSGAMTNSIDEFRHTPLVFVIGSNTTECHPVMGIMLRQAAEAGETTLIVADPRKISLTRQAHLHLQHRPGTDVALINGMMNVILEEGLADERFIAERTENYEAFRAAVAECPPALAAKIAEVPEEDIRRAARLYAGASSASIVYSMGITQHTTGTDNVLSLANLAMLTGNVGKEFAGVNPLRGQNNVQGACDMGALPNVYSGYQSVEAAEARKKFETAWGRKLPGKAGLTVVEIMNAAADGGIKGLYIMGENPMLSDPDINHVREALETVDFLVVQDIFLSETAELADVVLPACSFAEKEGTFTNTERRVQRVRAAVAAPGEAREDWRIICDLAGRMGYPMEYSGADAIQAEIASLTPIYGGITYDRLTGVGLQWPCTTPDHPGTRFLHSDKFTRGRGKFHPVRFLPPKEMPDEEYPFVLTTGRILEHWHTGTMTRRSEVLHELVPHGTLELNPADADALGVADGETVAVSSRRGAVRVPAAVCDRTAPGTVFLAFHFKEHPANALTIAALDPIAKIPEFKACAVAVRKAAAG